MKPRVWTRSAFDKYQNTEYFTGWQPTQVQKDEDIFKQLKLNLNKYQRIYNQSKQKNIKDVNIQHHSAKKTLQDKQNDFKLPSIYSGPLKQNFTNKQPFTLKNRNILEEAMSHHENHKIKCQKVLRFIKIRKNRHFQNNNRLDYPDLRLNFDKNAIPLKQNDEIEVRRKTKSKNFTKRTARQELDYDFSDSRLIIRRSRPKLKLYHEQIQKQNE